MESFEVTQSLLSVGTHYQVRRRRSEDELYVIRGELMSTTARFRLAPAPGLEDSPEGVKAGVAELSANFLKTRYEIVERETVIATLVFPAVALKKTVVLTVGDKTYEADGGVFRGVFRFRETSRGDRREGVGRDVGLEIAKELSIRDTFLVSTGGELPLAVALLTAVAIHSRFYEMV